ncbi:MAG: N-acetyl-gamma-glutamyl-phosphate reductase [Campylobacterales bacterium]|nr:N-acetyl-gamma-glutamyl-phosphate reductase [Campylobacterales bacterium]
MINIGIIGASGYTGLELIKILINHPKFKINYIATTEGSENITNLHPSLENVFSCEVKKIDLKNVKNYCELVFLALPHKTAMAYTKELLKDGLKIIDLSADYRLKIENYEKFYCPHEDKENLSHAIYGLPEYFRDKIKDAKLIANPGCYPTASLLGILPFIDYIEDNSTIFIDAKSGVSGAGKKLTETSHFVTINENIFAYNPISHRHSPEIREKIEILKEKNIKTLFIPHLLPVTRGMLVSIYATLKTTINPIDILKNSYKDEFFIRVRENPVDIKSTSGTNFCDIYAKCDENSLFISSAIDNLLRGASSQAVVNANIMYGFDEKLAIPIISYVP